MKIALRAPSGFLCAENGGDNAGVMHANRPQAGAWETLQVESVDGQMALQTVNGCYLSAEGGGGGDIHANRLQVGAWEKWAISGPLIDGVPVSLRAVDGIHFLGVGTDANHTALVQSTTPQLWTVTVIEMNPVPVPEPPILVPTRLTANRSGFRNTANQRVVLAGVSAFMHYERYLRGEDIRPLLQQVKDLGFANAVRVFGMAYYVPVNAGRPAFKPQDYGDSYFEHIPAFCRLCAEYGMYVYWSAFPDNEIINVPDERGFFDRVVDKLKQVDNTLVELTNEQDAHSFNHIDPTQMNRPSGISACSGSYGDIGGPQPIPWDFCDYHQPRRYDPPTHIKDACVVDHPNYLAGTGVLLGEPDRYGTGGNTNTEQARLSFGAARESALGEFFHSMQGRESLLYDDTTMNIGKIALRALMGAA